MKRPHVSWTPLRGFIAGIACVLIAETGIAALVGSVGVATDDYKIERVISNEAGGWRAMLFTRMGGGAAGWCDQSVLVDSLTSPAPTAKFGAAAEWERVAFSASCGTPVVLSWIAVNELQVSFRISTRDLSRVQLRQNTANGAVRLRYVILQD